MGQAENYFVYCKWIYCSRWNFWIVENLICIAAISAAFWLNFAHSASIPSVHVMLTLQTIDIMWEYWPFSHVPEFSSLQKFMFDDILQNGPYLRNTKIQVVSCYSTAFFLLCLCQQLWFLKFQWGNFATSMAPFSSKICITHTTVVKYSNTFLTTTDATKTAVVPKP